MKNAKKPTFFIITGLILVFAWLTTFGIATYNGDNRNIWISGVGDIRWGIDIRGGVDVTFTPPADYDGEVTPEMIDAARSVIETRMMARNITDYEVYTDHVSKRIIVRFPWQAGDETFDPESAVNELGETAMLTFREGAPAAGESIEEFMANHNNIVLVGADVRRASPFYDTQQNEHGVSLELNESGREAFADATRRLAGQNVISIWMDNYMISSPNVNEPITGGNATITGNFDRDSAVALAERINGGALPFALETDSFSVIDPTMGMGARDAMAIAGIIAFIIMCAFMIIRYKILGMVAAIGLTGQLFGALAVISGFVGVFESFTLTIPGIAGIILSVGMGVDANVITAERIKEELRSGKTLDGAVQSGYKRAFAAIFDGNMTMAIVAFILMGAFGTPNSFSATMLSLVFRWFGPSAAGAIYAFGYTLLLGVILNFLFGVFFARVMTYSLIKYKSLRKVSLYGGYKNDTHKAELESKDKPAYDAVSNRKKFLVAPIIIAAVSIVLTFVIGIQVAIEFRGGTILSYTFEGELDTDAVQEAVEEHDVGTVNVRFGTAFGSELDNVTIEFASREGLTAEVQREISQSLAETFAENDLRTAGSQDVNPTMGRTFFLKCLVAVIFAFLVLMVYVALRFRKIGGWSAGAFTILALSINVVVVYSVFVFFRFPIDANFIAVILAVLCYSINDTLVVFDRIRENRTLHGNKKGYAELVNLSVKQSFTRSLNTTITTCVAMLTICVVALVTGIGSMLTFAFPLLIGLMFGFVTSLFISGPMWTAWQNRKK
ncbi:MAG: protein translocase subunit SecF [Oscillospiraceae bacterium]|nr:protein translocase subunit SecF [Oscillospiraceae bacterium]